MGWGAPAAVGVVKRPVVAVIGDDAFEYSIQCLYTAAQHKLPVVFVVVRNGEYGVLKDFAVLEKAPNLPGLDLPGLDIPTIAKGFGCHCAHDFRHALAHGPPEGGIRPVPDPGLPPDDQIVRMSSIQYAADRRASFDFSTDANGAQFRRQHDFSVRRKAPRC